jgi:hypothetical protein
MNEDAYEFIKFLEHKADVELNLLDKDVFELQCKINKTYNNGWNDGYNTAKNEDVEYP